MQQRICFSKRVGIISLLGVIVFITALALNALSKQSTSTNSRASKANLQIANDPTAAAPVKCNPFGYKVVKDSETGALWSWASKPISSNGVAGCASEKYTAGMATPVVTPLIYPSDSAVHSYTEYYAMLGYSPACYRHGITLSLENNSLKAMTQTEVNTIPSYLVGMRVSDTLCLEKSPSSCSKNRFKIINRICWHLGYDPENKLGVNSCKSNPVTDIRVCPGNTIR